jgi:outer membrane protein assembly factor BamB
MPAPGQRPSSSSRDLTLVVESESGTPEEYFAQVGLSIGRAKSNTIHINHPDVDHIHAKVVKREESFWLRCEGQAKLKVLDPEPGEMEEVELTPGLTIQLGGVIIRCRRQMRGMSSLSDDYWADAAGGERFKVEHESFNGELPKKIGPYEIRKFVARGGMGIVLRGIHQDTDQPAAVKLPTPDLNKDHQWLKRFEQEVRTLKSVTHPNLVRLQDAGKEGDLHWMAMDWVEGWTVGERLAVYKEAGESMPLSEIQLVLRQVVEGLMTLHAKGVVHRDLKPSNLLVGQDGGVKVADFGLAKQVGGEQSTFLTRTGTFAGTMYYMAPEQAEGMDITPATDVYALGVIWHELLIAKKPGVGILKIRKFRPDCPSGWEEALAQCLDSEPEDRPGLSRIKQVLEAEASASDIEDEEEAQRKQRVEAQRKQKEEAQRKQQEEEQRKQEEEQRKQEEEQRKQEEEQRKQEEEQRKQEEEQRKQKEEDDAPEIVATAKRRASEIIPQDRKPNTPLWESKTVGEVQSSPAIGSDGTVYVGSDDNRLCALDGKTGLNLWEFETGRWVRSSLAIGSDGVVYIGSFDNKLYALDGKSGIKLWEFETEHYVDSSPAISSDGTVYVGSRDKKIYAINGKTGIKLWEFNTGRSVDSSPAIGSDGTVYVGSWDKKLYAINGKSGVKLWEFETGGFVSSSPAIGSDGTVYIGSWDKKLHAVDGKSGIKLWEFETESYVLSSPAIGSDGTVYVGSRDKKLYAINGKSGVKLWEFETEDWVDSSPAIGSDGTVYVGSFDKKLYAINGKSGVKLWEFETGGVVRSSPAIGSDGTLYVGSRDTKLYAIKTDSKGLAKSPWPMRGQNALHTGRVLKK